MAPTEPAPRSLPSRLPSGLRPRRLITRALVVSLVAPLRTEKLPAGGEAARSRCAPQDRPPGVLAAGLTSTAWTPAQFPGAPTQARVEGAAPRGGDGDPAQRRPTHAPANSPGSLPLDSRVSPVRGLLAADRVRIPPRIRSANQRPVLADHDCGERGHAHRFPIAPNQRVMAASGELGDRLRVDPSLEIDAAWQVGVWPERNWGNLTT